MVISREIFDKQRLPRFGRANPERMTLAFWEWMIRGDDASWANRTGGLVEGGFQLRDGKLKTNYGPYRAREFFNIPLNREEGPIWTFDRMGASKSRLPDERHVFIGGEHEDFYDPDFFIYNDVVVVQPKDQIEIYGYPKEVFPPTDFHSATIADGRIIIIGGLGYKNERRPGFTAVYSLDLANYCISQIRTSGEMPGWISEHEAGYEQPGIITIRGGQRVEERDSRQQIRRNFEDYALDLGSCVWRRLTNRNWRAFSIRQVKGAFLLEHRPKPEALVPRDIAQVVSFEGTADARFLVAETPVSLTIHITHIELVIQGNLPSSLLTRLTEEIRANTEAATGRHCILSQLD